MKHSVMGSVLTLRVGMKVLEDFEEQLKKMTFSYEEMKETQNNYELLLEQYCKEAYRKGKNDLSETEFKHWLEEIIVK